MVSENQSCPRIGVPYRTRNEEVKGVRKKYENYLRAIEQAGGAAVEISLALPSNELQALVETLDAIVLPGSPADVNPALYGAARHPESADDDADRERTDLALLEHAFAETKPVLAICYGIQILNVFLDGSLIQDIPNELRTAIQHSPTKNIHPGASEPAAEPLHAVHFAPDSRIAKTFGALDAQVNSSHHQAIREPGRDLRIVGRATDGVVEAVEWTGDSNWVTGVQWHPERMADDALAQTLFRELIAAARGATIRS
ncbi:MAG TPA: gamma-glutamyl-gamma-aminobutyrate hydrolase family protein [Candidatus Acidoferrales bacterium]|jgi:putative glutamine amidotransferase|nr:gamma-glutamyl-gamma-aminobutyrate hydrolase family protein [Candidatus Acidoferrales bacterium]